MSKTTRNQRRQKRKGKRGPKVPDFDAAALERRVSGIPVHFRDAYRRAFIRASRIARRDKGDADFVDALYREIDASCGEWERREHPACRAGCNWCCHQDVLIAPFELEVVFNEVRRLGIEELVRERLGRDSGTIVVAGAGVEVAISPCPLLEDGRCMIYEKRPISCRTQFAMDADKCRRAYEAARDSGMDVDYDRAGIPAVTGVASREAVEPKQRLLLREALGRRLVEPSPGDIAVDD